MNNDFERIQKKVSANYQPLRDRCIARVTRWVHATGPLFEFLPLDNLFANAKPGRETDSEAKARIKYGFDAGGRLVCSFERNPKTGESPYENLLLEVEGKTFLARFLVYPATRKREALAMLQGGFRQLVYAPDGKLLRSISDEDRATYLWKGNRLIGIKGQDEDGDRFEKEVLYDDLGQVKEVSWMIAGKHRILYQQPAAGDRLKSLEPVLRQKLLAAIQKSAGQCGIKQPVYCLALAYDGEGNDVLPPCIGFGLDSERQRWVKELGKDARTKLWNPAEFAHYETDKTQLDDEELAKACDLFNDLLRAKQSYAPAMKLLVSVAAELAKVNWNGKLKVTPDFVVYAVDFELGHLNRNLKQSVPAPLLAKLKQARLL